MKYIPLGALSLLLAYSAVEANDTSKWQNELMGDVGYRRDSLNHSGAEVSPSIIYREQKISNIQMAQFDIQDRLSWNDAVFIKGLAGFGTICSADDARYHTMVGSYRSPPVQYNVERNLQTEHAPSSGITRELSNTHYNNGYAWNFDISVGGMYSPPKWKKRISVQPIVGYLYQNLSIHNATNTQFYGPYAGLNLPIRFGKFFIIPEAEYLFSGSRHEKISLPNYFTGKFNSYNLKGGTVTGLRTSLSFEYAITSAWHIGLNWKYSNFNASSAPVNTVGDFIYWMPSTKWISNQYLVRMSYDF